MEIRPIPQIHGAYARSDGMIKFPDSMAEMPNGGVRNYVTSWIFGVKRKAEKTARHEYYGTTYRGKSFKVHRLVCEAFHGPAPDGMPVVLHLNEDALDNRPENLRWGTQKENLNMPKFIEYCKGRTGDNSPRSKGKSSNSRSASLTI